MKIYRDHCYEIDQETAYFGDILKTNTHYIIPFLNIGVTKNHPLSLNKKHTYIDKAYWVFENIKSVKEFIYYPDSGYITNQEIFNTNYERNEVYLLGGELFKSMQKSSQSLYFEWEIWAESCFLQILENSKLSNDLFIPFDTPAFKQNVNINNMAEFLENKHLPDNLKKLIESDTSTIRKVYQTDYQEPVLA